MVMDVFGVDFVCFFYESNIFIWDGFNVFNKLIECHRIAVLVCFP